MNQVQLARSLTVRQLKGLNRLGDAFVGQVDGLPQFSELGCAEHYQKMTLTMEKGDFDDIRLLLGIFSFLPVWMIRGLFWELELSPYIPGPIGAVLRLARMGLKGLVVSLYYSGYHGENYQGKTPNEIIGYNASVDPLE